MTASHQDDLAAVRRQIETKLRKLLELARRGELGERANAEALLLAALARHGITLADLERPTLAMRSFDFAGELERDLLLQILGQITHAGDRIEVLEEPGALSIALSATEAAEAAIAYDTYRRQLARELERFKIAFLSKHGLAIAPADADDQAEPLDAAASAAIAKIIEALETIDGPRPRIERAGEETQS